MNILGRLKASIESMTRGSPYFAEPAIYSAATGSMQFQERPFNLCGAIIYTLGSIICFFGPPFERGTHYQNRATRITTTVELEVSTT